LKRFGSGNSNNGDPEATAFQAWEMPKDRDETVMTLQSELMETRRRLEVAHRDISNMAKEVEVSIDAA